MEKSRIEIVTNFYEALNRNDIPTCLSFFDETIERFESFGEHCHGLVELKRNFTEGRDTWAEGGCIPEKFSSEGDKVIVFVHVLVRQKNKTEWIDGQVTDVFTFKGEKVVEFFSFDKRDEALKWAGK